MNLKGQIVWKDNRQYRRTVRNIEQKMFGLTGEVTISGKRYLVTKEDRAYSAWQVSFEIEKEE